MLARDWLLCPKALILGRVDIAACPGWLTSRALFG